MELGTSGERSARVSRGQVRRRCLHGQGSRLRSQEHWWRSSGELRPPAQDDFGGSANVPLRKGHGLRPWFASHRRWQRVLSVQAIRPVLPPPSTCLQRLGISWTHLGLLPQLGNDLSRSESEAHAVRKVHCFIHLSVHHHRLESKPEGLAHLVESINCCPWPKPRRSFLTFPKVEV